MQQRDEGLKEIAMRIIVRYPAKALTPKSIERADAALRNDKEGRQYIKQEVIDALIRENRLMNNTLPLFFFEKDQRRLSFKGASKITETFIESVCQVTTALEYIDLSSCFLLRDSAIPMVLKHCEGLRSLKIENCRKMTDVTLDHVIDLGRSLQALNIGGDFNMTEAGLLKLVTSHPNRHNFKDLSISGLTYTGRVLDGIASGSPKMRHLGLGYSNYMTEKALIDLLRSLRLRKLHVHWCQRAVTDHLLEMIGEECHELEELNICGAKAVTVEAIEQLLIKCNPLATQQQGPDAMEEDQPDGMISSSSSKRKGIGDISTSSGNQQNGERKRFRRLKLRYAGPSRNGIDVIEDIWGDDIEFQH